MNSFHCQGTEQSWYLYYYFKRGTSSDYLSIELDKYKHDDLKAREVFAKLCARACAEKKLKFDYVVRALGSDETTAKVGQRVIPIAEAVAEATDAEYNPTLIVKKRKTEPFKYLGSVAKRRAELEGVYAINGENKIDLNFKRVLIVDDISTSGTTIEFIANAIHEQYPFALVSGFCLAHTKSPDWDGIAANKPEWIEQYRNEQNQ